MKVKMKYILGIFSVLIFFKINAQQNIDSLLIIAANNNPGLKAKYNKFLADMQKVSQVGSLSNPEITFGYFIQPMELMEGKQIGQIQFMQMFPWFGTLKASKDEASAMALSSFESFVAEKAEVFYNVRTSYYQLYYNLQQIKVYDSTLVLLKSIEQLLLIKSQLINSGTNISVNTENQLSNNNGVQGNNSMGMNSGKRGLGLQGSSMNNQQMGSNGSAFTDLLRIQVEIKELEDNLAYLKNRQQILTIQINILLNRKTDTKIIVPDSLTIPKLDLQNQSLFDSIKANNPMIKMNKADILAYQKQLQMNKKMGYPMIGLGLNYMLIDKAAGNTSSMNGKDMIMPMLTIKLPIYRKKYKASVKEAQLMENSATEQLTNVENMLLMEFSEYQFGLKEAERKLSIYKDIISLTQNNFNISLAQYSSSGTDLDVLIRIHRQLLDYKLNITQARVDKLTAIAGLQKLLSNN